MNYKIRPSFLNTIKNKTIPFKLEQLNTMQLKNKKYKLCNQTLTLQIFHFLDFLLLAFFDFLLKAYKSAPSSSLSSSIAGIFFRNKPAT